MKRLRRIGHLRVMAAFCLVWVLFAACKKGPSITIKHSPACQVELLLKNGTRIFIDTTNEKELTAPPTSRDILLVTFNQPDHRNVPFIEKFPGKKLVLTEGTMEGDGYSIRSIPSSDNEIDWINNYLLIIETDGIRIAHLGDLGQAAFTSSQLEALGRVDICFAQLENNYSGMSLTNKKGYKLIEELNPRYVFPTHFQERSLEYTIKNYPVLTGGSEPIRLYASQFPEKTTFILTGSLSGAYRKLYQLKPLPGTK